MKPIALTVTTNASGAGSVTVNVGYHALLFGVEWGLGTFDAGVDAVLKNDNTLNGTDETILTLTDANTSRKYYPRILEQDLAGADLTTRTLPLVGGDVTLTIASGGNVKTGTLWLYLLEA